MAIFIRPVLYASRLVIVKTFSARRTPDENFLHSQFLCLVQQHPLRAWLCTRASVILCRDLNFGVLMTRRKAAVILIRPFHAHGGQ
jgi:hypothetical protein